MIKNNRNYLFWIISFAIIINVIISGNNNVVAEKMIETPYGPVKPLNFSKYKEYYAERSFYEYDGSEYSAGVITDLVLSLTEENIREKKGETTTKDDFIHYCGPCHGEKGNGDGQFAAADLTPKPTDLTDLPYMANLDNSHITNVITGGSQSVGKSNLCPPWGNTFDKKWISNMVLFIRSLSSGDKATKAAQAKVAVKSEVETEKKTKTNDEEEGNVVRWIILGFATAFFIGVAVLEWNWLSKKK